MTVTRVKLGIVFALLVTFIIGCTTDGSKRYSIAESKTYEASLFRQNCTICHGPEAEGKTLEDGRAIPNLREGDFKYKTDEQIYSHIADGGNGMVPFRGQLTRREIDMLVQFVQKELRKPEGR